MSQRSKKTKIGDIPELLADWDWDKNINLPCDVSYGSAKTVFFGNAKYADIHGKHPHIREVRMDAVVLNVQKNNVV